MTETCPQLAEIPEENVAASPGPVTAATLSNWRRTHFRRALWPKMLDRARDLLFDGSCSAAELIGAFALAVTDEEGGPPAKLSARGDRAVIELGALIVDLVKRTPRPPKPWPPVDEKAAKAAKPVKEPKCGGSAPRDPGQEGCRGRSPRKEPKPRGQKRVVDPADADGTPKKRARRATAGTKKQAADGGDDPIVVSD